MDLEHLSLSLSFRRVKMAGLVCRRSLRALWTTRAPPTLNEAINKQIGVSTEARWTRP